MSENICDEEGRKECVTSRRKNVRRTEERMRDKRKERLHDKKEKQNT